VIRLSRGRKGWNAMSNGHPPHAAEHRDHATPKKLKSRVDDQYHPSGNDPVVSKLPIADAVAEQDIQLRLRGSTPVVVAAGVEFLGVLGRLAE
jgi:hypothetical protein